MQPASVATAKPSQRRRTSQRASDGGQARGTVAVRPIRSKASDGKAEPAIYGGGDINCLTCDQQRRQRQCQVRGGDNSQRAEGGEADGDSDSHGKQGGSGGGECKAWPAAAVYAAGGEAEGTNAISRAERATAATARPSQQHEKTATALTLQAVRSRKRARRSDNARAGGSGD